MMTGSGVEEDEEEEVQAQVGIKRRFDLGLYEIGKPQFVLNTVIE